VESKTLTFVNCSNRRDVRIFGILEGPVAVPAKNPGGDRLFQPWSAGQGSHAARQKDADSRDCWHRFSMNRRQIENRNFNLTPLVNNVREPFRRLAS
jgi:hypothetical protein